MCYIRADLNCHQRHPLKLGSRLQTINHLVSKPYQHIWDCCCDHGFLGMALLNRSAALKIHFVDIVEPLMNELSLSLQGLNSPNNWKVHCLDVAQLPLVNEEKALASEVISLTNSLINVPRHLIIIAGVGGERLIELMQGIIAKHPNTHLEFILCPVHHNFKVREYLAGQSMGLIEEVLVKENKRFYEVLQVSTHGDREISLVGNYMWNFDDVDHQMYLQRTIEHYQFKRNDSNLDAKKIVALYKGLIK
ncbi:MAG: tRNA (adenine(22)-N(1))-methyltransferase TrmK [Bermanella sp.]